MTGLVFLDPVALTILYSLVQHPESDVIDKPLKCRAFQGERVFPIAQQVAYWHHINYLTGDSLFET